MPNISRTARRLAPAMTPVPGEAGTSRTFEARNRPSTMCGIVRSRADRCELRPDLLRPSRSRGNRGAWRSRSLVPAGHRPRPGPRQVPSALHGLGRAIDADRGRLEGTVVVEHFSHCAAPRMNRDQNSRPPSGRRLRATGRGIGNRCGRTRPSRCRRPSLARRAWCRPAWRRRCRRGRFALSRELAGRSSCRRSSMTCP